MNYDIDLYHQQCFDDPGFFRENQDALYVELIYPHLDQVVPTELSAALNFFTQQYTLLRQRDYTLVSPYLYQFSESYHDMMVPVLLEQALQDALTSEAAELVWQALQYVYPEHLENLASTILNGPFGDTYTFPLFWPQAYRPAEFILLKQYRYVIKAEFIPGLIFLATYRGTTYPTEYLKLLSN